MQTTCFYDVARANFIFIVSGPGVCAGVKFGMDHRRPRLIYYMTSAELARVAGSLTPGPAPSAGPGTGRGAA